MSNLVKPKFSTEVFIEKARKAHRDSFDYKDTVYTGSKNKVTLICPKGHKFSQQAGKHMHGTGCPKCNTSKKKVVSEQWYSKR